MVLPPPPGAWPASRIGIVANGRCSAPATVVARVAGIATPRQQRRPGQREGNPDHLARAHPLLEDQPRERVQRPDDEDDQDSAEELRRDEGRRRTRARVQSWAAAWTGSHGAEKGGV